MTKSERIQKMLARQLAEQLDGCPDPVEDALGSEITVQYNFAKRPGIIVLETEEDVYTVHLSVQLTTSPRRHKPARTFLYHEPRRDQ